MSRNAALSVVLLIVTFLAPSFLSPGPTAAATPWIIESTPFHDGPVSLAVDREGNPHISFCYYAEVTYAYRDALGWHSQTVGPCTSFQPPYTSIALDRQGYPHLCYEGGYADFTRGDLMYAYEDAAGWHVEHATQESGNEGSDCSLALDANDRPHIAYHDNLVSSSEGSLRYAYKDGTGWHVEWLGVNGVQPDIAIDSHGNVRMSYVGLRGDVGWHQLSYAHKDASGWHTVDLDTSSGSGDSNSLALDTEDHPRISYYRGPDKLGYAYQNAAGWHLDTLDSGIGRYTSLALDRQDKTHIGYADGTNRDLRYVSGGPGAWSSVLVDSTGYVGENTALALDAAGQPHILYSDATNHKLKYAHLVQVAGPPPVYLPMIAMP